MTASPWASRERHSFQQNQGQMVQCSCVTSIRSTWGLRVRETREVSPTSQSVGARPGGDQTGNRKFSWSSTGGAQAPKEAKWFVCSW